MAGVDTKIVELLLSVVYNVECTDNLRERFRLFSIAIILLADYNSEPEYLDGLWGEKTDSWN